MLAVSQHAFQIWRFKSVFLNDDEHQIPSVIQSIEPGDFVILIHSEGKEWVTCLTKFGVAFISERAFW